MKKTLLAAFFSIGLGLSLQPLCAQNSGQPPRNPETMAAKQTEQMATRLQLTEEQKAQALEINTRYAHQFMALREQGQPQRDAMMDLAKRQGEEMKAVLTEDQFAEYQKMRKENAKKMKGRRGGKGQPGGGNPEGGMEF
ncbi:hypothetical protein GC167_01470 [bacterium]|nr:hypothetical protein [bacterium]